MSSKTKTTSIAGRFNYFKKKENYFFSAGFSAFFSALQSFLSLLQHSFFFASSLTVEAVTAEVANPIVKATANTIANLFMLSNFNC